MVDIGPFPIKWLHGIENYIEIERWYPLPPNLINKGQEWIPELKLNATVLFLNNEYVKQKRLSLL
jgi:hypothetical protein